jgi:AbrB family looped-hinge helix DNA binding protein
LFISIKEVFNQCESFKHTEGLQILTNPLVVERIKYCNRLTTQLLLCILTKILSIWIEPEMSNTATLSSKFQISIPKAIRETMHWSAGQEFVFLPKGDGLLVMPVPELNQLRGIAKGANPDNYRDRKDRY